MLFHFLSSVCSFSLDDSEFRHLLLALSVTSLLDTYTQDSQSQYPGPRETTRNSSHFSVCCVKLGSANAVSCPEFSGLAIPNPFFQVNLYALSHFFRSCRYSSTTIVAPFTHVSRGSFVIVPAGTSRNQGNRYYPFVTILLLDLAITGDVMLNVRGSRSQSAGITLSQREALCQSREIYSAGAVANPRIYLWNRARNLPDGHRACAIRSLHLRATLRWASQVSKGQPLREELYFLRSAIARPSASIGQCGCSTSWSVRVLGKFNSGPSRRRYTVRMCSLPRRSPCRWT